MKNYFKKGTKGDYSFIVGYRKSFTIDDGGEKIPTIKVYMNDGTSDEYEYTTLAEINVLKTMREQFQSIDKSKLKGRALKEFEKQQFFLAHEDAINKALFTKAKKDGFYKGVKNVSPSMIELIQRFPICEKQFARSISFEDPHMRVINNAELAEKLEITIEELQDIKAQNPNPGMDNFSFLISLDRLDPDEIQLGLANYGFDLMHYTKQEIISVLTGTISAEKARELGMRLITKEEFAQSLNMSSSDLAYIESLRHDENIPQIPLITINDLDSYNIEDLQNILNGSYGKEYETSTAKRKVTTKAKRLSFTPLKERIMNIGTGKRAIYY